MGYSMAMVSTRGGFLRHLAAAAFTSLTLPSTSASEDDTNRVTVNKPQILVELEALASKAIDELRLEYISRLKDKLAEVTYDNPDNSILLRDGLKDYFLEKLADIKSSFDYHHHLTEFAKPISAYRFLIWRKVAEVTFSSEELSKFDTTRDLCFESISKGFICRQYRRNLQEADLAIKLIRLLDSVTDPTSSCVPDTTSCLESLRDYFSAQIKINPVYAQTASAAFIKTNSSAADVPEELHRIVTQKSPVLNTDSWSSISAAFQAPGPSNDQLNLRTRYKDYFYTQQLSESDGERQVRRWKLKLCYSYQDEQFLVVQALPKNGDREGPFLEISANKLALAIKDSNLDQLLNDAVSKHQKILQDSQTNLAQGLKLPKEGKTGFTILTPRETDSTLSAMLGQVMLLDTVMRERYQGVALPLLVSNDPLKDLRQVVAEASHNGMEALVIQVLAHGELNGLLFRSSIEERDGLEERQRVVITYKDLDDIQREFPKIRLNFILNSCRSGGVPRRYQDSEMIVHHANFFGMAHPDALLYTALTPASWWMNDKGELPGGIPAWLLERCGSMPGWMLIAELARVENTEKPFGEVFLDFMRNVRKLGLGQPWFNCANGHIAIGQNSSEGTLQGLGALS